MFDEEKFNAIVAKHSKALWLYCFDKLKKKELADETLNDILTVLWKKWDRIDTEDNIRAYLSSCRSLHQTQSKQGFQVLRKKRFL